MGLEIRQIRFRTIRFKIQFIKTCNHKENKILKCKQICYLNQSYSVLSKKGGFQENVINNLESLIHIETEGGRYKQIVSKVI